MALAMHHVVSDLEANISRVVLGKPEVVRLCLVAMLAGEHILLEDVPGVGKTLIGKALAKSVSGRFCRIQFTPDLLPSDITGTSIFQPRTGEFIFNQGPIFANVVLADEINRTTPRTQSALLEAMSDGQVSVDGQTHFLPRPFLVIATQNPYEFEGTYPLLESQLDRFLLRTSIGYADREQERQILTMHRDGVPVEELASVVSGEQLLKAQEEVRQIDFDQAIQDYLLDIVDATRNEEALTFGVSTRAALSLYRAAQAIALIENRDYVIPDDVKRLAVPVLAHRVIPRGYGLGNRREAVEGIVRRLVERIPVPR